MRNYSDQTAADIDDEINRIITQAYNRTKDILTENIDKLHVVAKALIEREKIDGDEFKILMDGGELPEVKEEADEPSETKESAEPTEVPSEETKVSDSQESGEETQSE